MNTYLVGKGSKLNPNGVFVVERPELAAFFKSLSSFAGEHLHAGNVVQPLSLTSDFLSWCKLAR